MSYEFDRKEKVRALLAGLERINLRTTYKWKDFMIQLKEKGNEQ